MLTCHSTSPPESRELRTHAGAGHVAGACLPESSGNEKAQTGEGQNSQHGAAKLCKHTLQLLKAPCIGNVFYQMPFQRVPLSRDAPHLPMGGEESSKMQRASQSHIPIMLRTWSVIEPIQPLRLSSLLPEIEQLCSLTTTNATLP
eukprot:2594969-Amphidinium_carterae.2